MNYVRRFFRKTATSYLFRKLTATSRKLYKETFQGREIAESNIDEVIHSNFVAARNVFIGFMGGQPAEDDGRLMYCTKVIDNGSLSERNFLLAQDFVNRLGFSLLLAEGSESTLKVMLIPGQDLSRYLTAQALDKGYHAVGELYNRIR